ncbi:Ribokinase-like protein [Peniophora sp. CONT]|nr:Ribokinase-like protein [Peniophora sp. CONT]
MSSSLASALSERRAFVTLGMFIIDEFSYADAEGKPTRNRTAEIGGGGTYASVGARIWLVLPADDIGMVVDAGADFPPEMRTTLDVYGRDMWRFRPSSQGTTRALNKYHGELRGFEYLTPRIRITPRDLVGTPLAEPRVLHFICSPQRAHVIVSELKELGWSPTSVYEPIPDRCVPDELPALIKILPDIAILSPNAEEALSLLSITEPVSRETVERAAKRFIEYGIGPDAKGHVLIRSGALGCYVVSKDRPGEWVAAYHQDQTKVVDVTGGGNSFLGGLAAGLKLSQGDVYQAVLYASVSASFVIEQYGLPSLTKRVPNDVEAEEWNGDSPRRRLQTYKR